MMSWQFLQVKIFFKMMNCTKYGVCCWYKLVHNISHVFRFRCSSYLFSYFSVTIIICVCLFLKSQTIIKLLYIYMYLYMISDHKLVLWTCDGWLHSWVANINFNFRSKFYGKFNTLIYIATQSVKQSNILTGYNYVAVF